MKKSSKRVVESASRTANGDSGVLTGALGASDAARFYLDVTAATGTTPTLDVVIEDTPNGVDFYEVAAFTQQTAAGQEAIDVTSPFAGRLRARWTIAGTSPDFTFSIDLTEQIPEF